MPNRSDFHWHPPDHAMTYLLQFLCDMLSLTISYTLLAPHNLFLYMFSQDNDWVQLKSLAVPRAGFGHLSRKPWTCNTSAIFCVKIKPF
jgi:hypothetical protein